MRLWRKPTRGKHGCLLIEIDYAVTVTDRTPIAFAVDGQTPEDCKYTREWLYNVRKDGHSVDAFLPPEDRPVSSPPQRQVAVEVSYYVCPFCHHIGPPLLCGCVTELYDALKMADEDLVTEEYTRAAISKHADRVHILNDALQQAPRR